VETVVDLADADRGYLERVAEDCQLILGPGIEIRELRLAANDGVVLCLRYRLGAVERTTEGHGETVIAAHAALRDRLVGDRIGLGFRAIIA
jgi:hypothetical protein